MARLRGGLGASPDQDPNQNQALPQVGGAMGSTPQPNPMGDPAQGNLEKPRELFSSANAAPTQGLNDPSKSTLPGGTDPNEHSNDAPGRPQSPTPIASQPPQTFTPLPSQDMSSMTSSLMTPSAGKANMDPAGFTSPVFGGSASLRSPGSLLSGGSGGQLRGGLGAPADGDQSGDPLSQLLMRVLGKGGQGGAV